MFDSGVGGLTIWQAVSSLLPAESLHYFADTAHCPYGPRAAVEVAGYCEAMVRFLLERRCKLIVVACNTATAMAIDGLRAKFPVPFVGIEPGVKPAALESHTGVIGVLATAGTFQGRLFNETKARFAQNVRVIMAEGAGLVELVEAGKADSPEAEAVLRRHLEPMLAAGMDRLVLGCTHYPFLSGAIRRIVGDAVELITPGAAVAQRTKHLLEERGLLADGTGGRGRHRFYSSGHTATLAAMLAGLPEYQNILRMRSNDTASRSISSVVL